MPHGGRMLLPEDVRHVVKKKKKRKHCKETTKTKSNEDVFEIWSAEHLADNVTSKPVYGFQYFWRDHAASFWPQSKDTNFRPNFAVLVNTIEALKKVEECETRTTANEGISQEFIL